MFTANLYQFKTQQAELQRQADHYRLLKSLEKKASPASRLAISLGKQLIRSGRELQGLAQTMETSSR